MEVVKDVPVVDALILDRFVLFEKSPSNQIVLVFGVEIAEYNMSNRLNVIIVILRFQSISSKALRNSINNGRLQI